MKVEPDPEHMVLVGGGDYREIARIQLATLTRLAGIQPDSHVLDVGCGFGRSAFSLVDYLSRGSYDGFDGNAAMVDWATQNITREYPNFKFQHASVYNGFYSSHGTVKPENFVFPYADGTFDLVFLFSVFTHMFPAGVRRYLDEIRRVLRSRGTCLATFFLLTPESERLIANGKSTLTISVPHPSGECSILDPHNPEAAVGFDRDLVSGWIQERGFNGICIEHGTWSGRENGLDYQDVLVFEKTG